MLARTLYPTSDTAASSLAHSDAAQAFSHSFPAVVVLPETLLSVELQRYNRSVDLQAVSHAILCDPGATLQILRLVGEEYGDSRHRPWRIEDCIADLGLEDCIAALERGLLVRVPQIADIRRLWDESRTMATCAATAAEHGFEGIAPAQAYLGGLLACLNRIPALHGWAVSRAIDRADLALALADVWCLPDFLVDMFREAASSDSSSRWARLLHAAHRSAGIYPRISQMHALPRC